MITKLKLTVRPRHLDAALAEMKLQHLNRPVGHSDWCVIAQAGKEAFPDKSISSTSQTLSVRNSYVQHFAGDSMYLDITEAFDDGRFEDCRNLLPVTLELEEI